MYIYNKVNVKINVSNINYFNKLYKDIKIGEIIEVDINKLNKGSHTFIKVKCDNCEKEKELKYNQYIKNYNNGDYLCVSCKRKKNNVEKYGVENVFQIKEVKEKIIITNKEKYGVENISQLLEIQDKKRNTCKSKYGFEHHLQNKEILEKQKKTCLEKYGVDNISKLSNINNKKSINVLNTLNKKTIQCDNNIIKVNNKENTFIINCDICGEIEINRDLYYKRREYNIKLCTICNPIDNNSDRENQLLNFIKEHYNDNIIENSRNIIKPYELDIYLPELNLAFEFNGLYWHSEIYKDKYYHKTKYDMCKEKDIQLIQIYEDDWLYKQDIIKSMILNKIGKTKEKIFARKCEIREIENNKIIKIFLEENHLQGFVGSTKKIGLYYNGEIVSLMTFIKNGNNYELNRFCNKKYTTVIGSASKLLKYFIDTYTCDNIISFSANDYSNGNLYKELNFKIDKELNVDYSYIKTDKRYHKFNFRKSKFNDIKNLTEKEYMFNNKIYRIYDSGKIRWIYKKKVVN